MKRVFLALVAVGVLWTSTAHSQGQSAIVVTTCGTPPATYVAGQFYPVTQDVNGNVCNNGSGGASSVALTPTGQASLSATTTTSNVALGSAGPTALVSNTGATTAYVKFGNNSVTATTSNYPILAGQSIAFNVGSNTYMAGITGSGTDTLLITTGTGIPQVTNGPLTVTVNAATATTTIASFSITSGNSFQSVLTSNSSRKSCLVQNTSQHIMYVFFGANGSATTGTSVQVQPYQTVTCASNGYTLTDNVSVTTSTTGDTGIVNSQ